MPLKIFGIQSFRHSGQRAARVTDAYQFASGVFMLVLTACVSRLTESTAQCYMYLHEAHKCSDLEITLHALEQAG